MKNIFGSLLFSVFIFYSHKVFSDPISDGKTAYHKHSCQVCHAIGHEGNAKVGPNLEGVTKIRTEQWIKSWLKNPDSMQKDPDVITMLTKYKLHMPNLHLSDKEVENIYAYFKSLDDKILQPESKKP